MPQTMDQYWSTLVLHLKTSSFHQNHDKGLSKEPTNFALLSHSFTLWSYVEVAEPLTVDLFIHMYRAFVDYFITPNDE